MERETGRKGEDGYGREGKGRGRWRWRRRGGGEEGEKVERRKKKSMYFYHIFSRSNPGEAGFENLGMNISVVNIRNCTNLRRFCQCL